MSPGRRYRNTCAFFVTPGSSSNDETEPAGCTASDRKASTSCVRFWSSSGTPGSSRSASKPSARRGAKVVAATPESEAIIREIYVDATPETVFEFFTDSVKLTRWLAVEATVDPRPGEALGYVKS